MDVVDRAAMKGPNKGEGKENVRNVFVVIGTRNCFPEAAYLLQSS